MTLPEIPGYRIESLIGKGACGSVYTGRHESGTEVAIKLLDKNTCNPELIASRVGRLYSSAPPRAALPLVAHSLGKDPYLLICALAADRVPQQSGGDRYVPRSLQIQLRDYLGKRGSWLLVRKLAHAIGEFHRRRVAHGNLKPGNIYFDADGELLLADYAQGLMPSITELPYTDALLYAPPEQLMNPDGYLEGAGYGWDVYAFGTLAFRLINGVFPRCHETFEQVSPPPGEQRRRGVEADCERIADKVRSTTIAAWKGEVPTAEEEAGRKVIERCLSLDPAERFADMREVLRALEGIATARQMRLTEEENREKVELIEKRRRGWRTVAGLGLAACLALGAVMTHQVLHDPPKRPVAGTGTEAGASAGAAETRVDPELLRLEKEAAALARAERDHLERSTDGLRSRYLDMAEDLSAAFSLSDQLVSWSVERGAQNLPTLEGRDGRLAVLESSLVQLLNRSENHEPLQRNAWRIKLALAEVALAADKPKVARARMKEVLDEAVAEDEATMMRLARARVLVCMLGAKDPESGVTPTELAETATVLSSLPQENRETRRLQSALKVAEARVQFQEGDGVAALENYRTAFAEMTRLCEEQPSLSALRIWRARGYSEAARAAHGEGGIDAALILREQAAAELMELLEAEPNRSEVQVELSLALGAIAESALEAGEMERAEDLASRSLELLEAAKMNPEEREAALVQLAAQKSVLAACRASAGHDRDALRLVREGVTHAKLALERDAGDPIARYRLAILTWQECGLRTSAGSHTDALTLGAQARSLLLALRAEGVAHPSQREISRSLAYLTSDLGHAAQLAGRDSDSINFFRESVVGWKALAEAEGTNAEFQEGYDWARTRLRELGVMSAAPR